MSKIKNQIFNRVVLPPTYFFSDCLLDLLHKSSFSKELKIYLQSMPIYQEHRIPSINSFNLYHSIFKHFYHLIGSHPACMEFPFKIFESRIIKEHPITWLELLLLDGLVMPLLALLLNRDVLLNNTPLEFI